MGLMVGLSLALLVIPVMVCGGEINFPFCSKKIPWWIRFLLLAHPFSFARVSLPGLAAKAVLISVWGPLVFSKQYWQLVLQFLLE